MGGRITLVMHDLWHYSLHCMSTCMFIMDTIKEHQLKHADATGEQLLKPDAIREQQLKWIQSESRS